MPKYVNNIYLCVVLTKFNIPNFAYSFEKLYMNIHTLILIAQYLLYTLSIKLQRALKH